MKQVREYTWLELQAAEVLTAVYFVGGEQAASNMARAKEQYAQEVAAGAEEYPWVFNEKTGKPLTFKQWCSGNFMGTAVGWWYYIELNEDEAPGVGPFATIEAAMGAGVRKYGRGKTARHEITWCLLLSTPYYLQRLADLGQPPYCDAPHPLNPLVDLSAPLVLVPYEPAPITEEFKAAEVLGARWRAMALAEQWADLRREWGFAPDQRLLLVLQKVVEANKLYEQLLAKNNAKAERVPTSEFVRVLQKRGHTWREVGPDQWQYKLPMHGREFYNDFTGNERALVLNLAAWEAITGKPIRGYANEYDLQSKAAEVTGAPYGLVGRI